MKQRAPYESHCIENASFNIGLLYFKKKFVRKICSFRYLKSIYREGSNFVSSLVKFFIQIKGSFLDYVDQILRISDHLPTTG